MFMKMDLALMNAKRKAGEFWDRLLHEEKGASDIVAIMVVIVILLAVAVIFKDNLISLVETVFGKANDWVEAN
ncbi:MAG TPA: flagellin-like protein [Candidatus Lachnoclostridium stercoravium]|uniref:Flagellin-like protein n=1 Tax=Candidatus Lachnoclostridium stercoravium TaxID=2838633 RepID=A0A9D2HHG2_9FIRM|nr:flagellin-like protein [Candidatus Lachnoclostridium stercoravium]